ncbi:hypothetical protein NAL32_12820 [Chryseobacterium sp. Ch-15]|uniref:Uncharacterized protein n=1 Tax=Chryseobacterium muglaense TaxID=2893752 RepID=A0A9Q3UZJ0_9FLAO|nr:hypothetical protein [Chryseobacterium muglaense]MBD3905402.1 hypothetical protein [Chryseobacterium muglaense]MCC9036873.1 hypothetical protein [Chryseobacterium muglaense]MCM2555265.1 hypothetical protein [Chryseobacterium muglaense]
MTSAVLLQNCIQRDDDLSTSHISSDMINDNTMMRSDSAGSRGETLYPDPPDEPDEPVRDGDNWRQIKK